jgi:uncharacterized protein YhaN
MRWRRNPDASRAAYEEERHIDDRVRKDAEEAKVRKSQRKKAERREKKRAEKVKAKIRRAEARAQLWALAKQFAVFVVALGPVVGSSLFALIDGIEALQFLERVGVSSSQVGVSSTEVTSVGGAVPIASCETGLEETRAVEMTAIGFEATDVPTRKFQSEISTHGKLAGAPD